MDTLSGIRVLRPSTVWLEPHRAWDTAREPVRLECGPLHWTRGGAGSEPISWRAVEALSDPAVVAALVGGWDAVDDHDVPLVRWRGVHLLCGTVPLWEALFTEDGEPYALISWTPVIEPLTNTQRECARRVLLQAMEEFDCPRFEYTRVFGPTWTAEPEPLVATTTDQPGFVRLTSLGAIHFLSSTIPSTSEGPDANAWGWRFAAN